MATILSQGTRRCDAVCHKATHTKCGCICGGKYHGSAIGNPQLLDAAKANRTAVQLLTDESIQPRLPLGEMK